MNAINPSLSTQQIDHIRELAALASQAQGACAFDCSISAASHHESGHAVIHAATGFPPASVSIKPVKHDAGWTGLTLYSDGHPGKRDLDIRNHPDEGIAVLACIIAGWAGEISFEDDAFRLGSSLDEVAQFNDMACAIAIHHELPHTLPFAIIETVLSILDQERATMVSLAMALRRENRIRGPKLLALLANVQKRDIPAMVRAML